MENFAAINCQKLFSHGLTKSSAELFFSEFLGPPFFQKVLMENFATISCQKLFSCGLIESSAELFFSELLDTPFFQKVLMENFAAISCQKLFLVVIYSWISFDVPFVIVNSMSYSFPSWTIQLYVYCSKHYLFQEEGRYSLDTLLCKKHPPIAFVHM